MTADATCRGLRSSVDGPFLLELSRGWILLSNDERAFSSFSSVAVPSVCLQEEALFLAQICAHGLLKLELLVHLHCRKIYSNNSAVRLIGESRFRLEYFEAYKSYDIHCPYAFRRTAKCWIAIEKRGEKSKRRFPKNRVNATNHHPAPLLPPSPHPHWRPFLVAIPSIKYPQIYVVSSWPRLFTIAWAPPVCREEWI